MANPFVERAPFRGRSPLRSSGPFAGRAPFVRLAQNLLTFSEQINNGAWSKFRSSVSADATAAPNGSVTADLLIEGVETNTHGASRFLNVTNGAVYTFSVFAKSGGRDWVVLDIGGSVYFDLSTGAVGSTAGGYTTSVTSAGGGWFRCAITRTAAATDMYPTVEIATGNGVKSYTGDGASGVYLWGAQLNPGALGAYVWTTSAARQIRTAAL